MQEAEGDFATVTAGQSNVASGTYSSVSGGNENVSISKVFRDVFLWVDVTCVQSISFNSYTP